MHPDDITLLAGRVAKVVKEVAAKEREDRRMEQAAIHKELIERCARLEKNNDELLTLTAELAERVYALELEKAGR